ncbi:hypothetical protein [Nocardia altamirensis]|uniref:hypothetical protein n=1 Tax=Nocardia altamirensis TaxID=472158 RepID=UPI00114D33A7|nr:hypothetical protein [Nocardia altamirensis]
MDQLKERRAAAAAAAQENFVDPDAVDVGPATEQSSTSTSAPSPVTSTPAEAAPPKRAPRKRTMAVTTDGRPTKSVNVVYVSEAVKRRFDAQRHKTRKVSHQLVLEAISKQRAELATIIENSRFSTAPVDDLFPADPKAVRYLGGGSAQIHYNITPDQDAVLDELTAELGFDTRSTWIAPVLNAYLGGRKEKLAGQG